MLAQDSDDLYMIEYARSKDGDADGRSGEVAYIVTNDMFRDHISAEGPAFGRWVKDHIISYSFVTDDEFVPNPVPMRRFNTAVRRAGATLMRERPHTAVPATVKPPAPPADTRVPVPRAAAAYGAGPPAPAVAHSNYVLSDSDEDDLTGDGPQATGAAGPAVPAHGSTAVFAPAQLAHRTMTTVVEPQLQPSQALTGVDLTTAVTACRVHVTGGHYIGGALPLHGIVPPAAAAVLALPRLPDNATVAEEVFRAAPQSLRAGSTGRGMAAMVRDMVPFAGQAMFLRGKEVLSPEQVGSLPQEYALAAFAAGAAKCLMGHWVNYVGRHSTVRRELLSRVIFRRVQGESPEGGLTPALLAATSTAVTKRRTEKWLLENSRSQGWLAKAEAAGVQAVQALGE